jgi:hypothetical protein
VDTFTTLWNRLQLRVPAAGPDLCQDLVRDAFNQLVERRPWSWRVKAGCFYPTTFTVTGTVNTTNGSAIITGVGTNFISAMVGFQIRIGGLLNATYTIIQVISATSIAVDRLWVGPTAVGQSYGVAQVYVTVPADFDYFYSVTNPTANYRLNFNVTQADLDSYDPQRSQVGQSFALAYLDTTPNFNGTVGPAIQVVGTGTAIASFTSGYSYPMDSIYTIRIATGGGIGVATFDWKQDSGITGGTGILTNTGLTDLSNGVQAYFQAGTYVAGDVFVIACKADATSGLARYELWPRPVASPYTYPFLYARRMPELSDDAPQLPARMRGDVLLEMALAQLALWPGTAEVPNPYRDLGVNRVHSTKAETMIYELEKLDNEVAMKDLISTLPYMGPWRDGSWLQTHASYE